MDDVTRAMSGGGVLVNVQELGCFSIFRRADDVTRTMSCPRGVLVNVLKAEGDDVTRAISKGGCL